MGRPNLVDTAPYFFNPYFRWTARRRDFSVVTAYLESVSHAKVATLAIFFFLYPVYVSRIFGWRRRRGGGGGGGGASKAPPRLPPH